MTTTTVTRYKLGKKPARPGAVKFRLSAYLDKAVIPAIPPAFGHQKLVADWGMLANDRVGDCAMAGAFHETMLWCAEGGKPIRVTDEVVLDTYSAVTGYDPAQTDAAGNNPSDEGTDPAEFAEYRRTTGITDADGNLHKIGAYLALDQGSVSQLGAAMYLFSAVGIGLALPDTAQDQFQAGQAWEPVPDSSIEGGHYVTGVARDNDSNIAVVTWGRLQWMTPSFYRRYNDETLVYLSEEFLTAGVSPEGFNLEQLQADLAALGH